MTVIKDGAGSGYSVKVDKLNRAHSYSVTDTAFNYALKRGKAYSASTGVITLTSANESALIYMSFSEAVGVVLDETIVTFGASTGGTGDVLTNVYVAPTTGTVISDATAGSIVNLNQTSADSLSAVIYTGAEGKTLSGEVTTIAGIGSTSSIYRPGKGGFLNNGSSFGMSVFPPVGNTSMSVIISFYFYIPEDI